MAELMQTLRKHFRFHPRRQTSGIPRGDNLPYAAKPLSHNKGRAGLALVLRDLGCKTGVEIGVSAGESAVEWLQVNPDLHLTCIDPWSNGRYRQNYEKAVAALAPYNATLVRSNSLDALRLFPNKTLDFVHIDGNHSFDFVCPDIVFWSHKLRSGGIMLVHDYLDFCNGGVVEAVNAYTRSHHIDPWFITREELPTAFWQKL